MIADAYKDHFERTLPMTWTLQGGPMNDVTREEFDVLKAKVEEMAAMLKAADEYDKRTGQPDCEMEDKIAFLRKVAEFVGIPDAVKPNSE